MHIDESSAKSACVDNDKNILAAFRLSLAGKGFRPILCNNAKDALSKVICSHVDCVVAELHLKGAMESGLEFLTSLRHARPQLPIIVITYELDSDLEKRIETLGVNACSRNRLTCIPLSEGLVRCFVFDQICMKRP